MHIGDILIIAGIVLAAIGATATYIYKRRKYLARKTSEAETAVREATSDLADRVRHAADDAEAVIKDRLGGK